MDMDVYAVTLHRFEDLEDFYNDMETEGGSITIPDRAVEVDLKKLTSRVTFYRLTPEEAEQVASDSRVKEVRPREKILKASFDAGYARTNEQTIEDLNWGLAIHQDPQFLNQGLPFTGKNVDIIILDDDGWQPDHPEFLDDAGNSRVVDYNWWQHAAEVGDSAHNSSITVPPGYEWLIPGPYDPTKDATGSYHNIHVAGTAAGRLNGWAKDANIYFFSLNFDHDNNDNTVSTELAFDYIRAFHRNKPINPETGRKNPTIVNNSWGYGGSTGDLFFNNDSVTEINYQGTKYIPEEKVYEYASKGYYGAASSTAMVASWPSDSVPAYNTIKITSTGNNTATSETIEYDGVPLEDEILADGGYTDIKNGNSTNMNETLIELPFTVNYLGTDYTSINVLYYSFIVFGSLSTQYNLGSPSQPAYPKLLLGSSGETPSSQKARSTKYAYTKVNGDAPNRTFTVVWGGYENILNALFAANLGVTSPYIVWKTVFHESEPSNIYVTFERNVARTVASGGWSNEDFYSRGCNRSRWAGTVSYINEEVMDAIDEGIIVVASAGNSNSAGFTLDNKNYNNNMVYSSERFYYNHAGTPASAGLGQDNAAISVGSISNNLEASKNKRAGTSCHGNSVDIWAAGRHIQSAFPEKGVSSVAPVTDANGFKYIKISGTSMACPQVTGILACLLEKYPDMNQKQARQILNTFSIQSEMYDLPLETWNFVNSLEGAANKYVFFKNIRVNNKPAYPKTHKGRPVTGAVYPRRQIRIRK